MTIPFGLAFVLASAGLALAVWMLVVEPRWFRARRLVFDAARMGLPPLRVLHVTDTHFHGRDGPILRFLEDLARTERFDLVFWTGDLIDARAGVESMGRAARLFRPRLGAFAVLGGHDYRRHGLLAAYLRLLSADGHKGFTIENPAGELKEALSAAGVEVLEDRACVLHAPGDRPIAVVGLRDAALFDPDYDAAWRDVPPGACVVALAHSPDVLPQVTARGARLAFCGHTHGGQVRFPFVGALVTRSDLPGRLASGAFRMNATTVIINNGLGASPATPFRLLCRPEVGIVEFGDLSDGRTPTRLKEADSG